MRVLEGLVGFEWDEGNRSKNWEKHRVKDEKCEEAFFDPDKKLLEDVLHASPSEPRFILLGQTKRRRLLFISFTVRSSKIRVISARDVHTKSKERELYEKEV